MPQVLQAVGRLWKILPPRVRTILSRLTHQTFTVSAAGVIRAPDGRVLLLNHVLRPRSGWGLPGGFVERGEQARDALEREAAEETGIALTDIELLCVDTFKQHIEILYKARTNGIPRVLSREITELRWFFANELPAEMDARLRSTICKVLDGDI